jgi:hypothetical protein
MFLIQDKVHQAIELTNAERDRKAAELAQRKQKTRYIQKSRSKKVPAESVTINMQTSE